MPSTKRNSRSPHGIQSPVTRSSAARGGGGGAGWRGGADLAPVPEAVARGEAPAERAEVVCGEWELGRRGDAENAQVFALVGLTRRGGREVAPRLSTAQQRMPGAKLDVRRRAGGAERRAAMLEHVDVVEDELRRLGDLPVAAGDGARGAGGCCEASAREFELGAEEVELAQAALVARSAVEMLEALDEVRGVRALAVVGREVGQ